MKYIKNFDAFTLAEVLIVLGIIGVVCAMTIPTLIQKQQEKQTVVALKKAYSTLSNAYNLAVQENGAPDMWGLATMYDESTHEIIANNFKKYLKVMVDCTGMSSYEIKEKCTKDTNLSPVVNAPEDYSFLVLSDGTLAVFRGWSSDCRWNNGNLKNICGQIITFLSPSNKSMVGKDTFEFYITKSRIVPFGSQIDGSHPFDNYCIWGKSGIIQEFTYQSGCTAWVLYNENMDYMHCDDLSWGGKTKCD